jgi:anti-sigma factor RsiW
MTNHPEGSLFSAYLDGVLGAEEKRDFSRHLDNCVLCRADLKSLEETKLRLAGAGRRAMPPDLIVAIEKKLDEARLRRAAPAADALSWFEGFRRTFFNQFLIPAAVAALVSLIVGLWFVRMRRGPDQFTPPNPVLSAQAQDPGQSAARPRSSVASNDDSAP